MQMNHKLPVFIALAFLISACSSSLVPLALEEPDGTLSTTTCLSDSTCLARIKTFYDKGDQGRFEGEAGVSIFYKVFKQKQPAPAILISTGRTEAAVKYKELIFDLYQHGYTVYIHDHRGQGQSGRMTEDSEMGYIDDFQRYVDDMKSFYKLAIKGHHDKVFLLAHSMGGCIGMSYLQQYPDDFTAAAFSSPMLGLKAPICALANIFGGEKAKYAISQGGYKHSKDSFEGNGLTFSPERYQFMVEAYEETPEARLGGATYPWLTESCKHIKQVQKKAPELKVPVLIFSASDEVVVDPKANLRFVEKAQKAGADARILGVEHAMHELFMEQDAQRNAVINASLSFFEQFR